MLEPGTQVGRFRVVRLISQGGMAEVYRASQELAPGIFRSAALKVIRPEYSESEDFREMFLDEARTACTLAHPNIVHIYEVGESDGLVYMGMELVPGESLATVAKTLRERGQRLSDAALLAVGIATCSALEAVHALMLPGSRSLNLVHRDVSPHNLLLDSAGSLKLIDFGIAKAATNQNITSPGITKGKAGYFSPEQALGHELDGRSDLFSVGVTLYKLASGVTPFDRHRELADRNQALLTGKWAPLEKVCPGLSPAFYEVVGKALQVRREDRFANAAKMREALEAVAFDVGLQVGPSALAGYVEEHDGEVSISGVNKIITTSGYRRKLVALAEQEEPRAQTALTERIRTRRALWALSAASVVVIAAVGSALLMREKPAPVAPIPKASVVQVSPPAPPPEPTPAAPVEEPGMEKEELATPLAPLPKPRSAESRALAPKPSKPTKSVLASAKVAAVKAIPKGEGQLRIGAAPDGEVVLNGKRVGTTPLNLKIQSGAYNVEIVHPGGAPRGGACSVTVLPDRTARLRYDFKGARCKVDYL